MAFIIRTLLSLVTYCIKIWCFPILWVSWLVERLTFPAPLEYSKKHYQILQSYMEAYLNGEVVWLKVDVKGIFSKNYTVPALHLKGRRESGASDKQRFTVLWGHGNGMDAFEQVLDMRTFYSGKEWVSDIELFCYEYPGYSLSRFTPKNIFETVNTTEANVNRAAEVAWTYLVMECKIPPNRIIVLGQSIGSGPTIHLASRDSLPNVPDELSPKNAAALILMSSPLSTGRVAVKDAPYLFPLVRCFDKFQNHEKIRQINPHMPVCTLHAQNDEVVPEEHMIQIENSLPGTGRQLLHLEHPRTGGHNFGSEPSERPKIKPTPPPSYRDYLVQQEFLKRSLEHLYSHPRTMERYPMDPVTTIDKNVMEEYESHFVEPPELRDFGRLKRFRCCIPWIVLIPILACFMVFVEPMETSNIILNASNSETEVPSLSPTMSPGNLPTIDIPTDVPIIVPTNEPTSFQPTSAPTSFPTTSTPTLFPTTSAPTSFPTSSAPTLFPTGVSNVPNVFPTLFPTDVPTPFTAASILGEN